MTADQETAKNAIIAAADNFEQAVRVGRNLNVRTEIYNSVHGDPKNRLFGVTCYDDTPVGKTADLPTTA